MIKVGDHVQLKKECVALMAVNQYAPTPTCPVTVRQVENRRYGLKEGQGAIEIGGAIETWRWACNFELTGGPW